MVVVFALLGLVGLAVHLSFAVGLSVWAGRVAKRRGGLFQPAVALPGLGFAVSLVGAWITVMGLTRAFGAVSAAAPEMRASTLASGISDAMNAIAFGLGASILLYATSAIVSAIGSRRPRETRA